MLFISAACLEGGAPGNHQPLPQVTQKSHFSPPLIPTLFKLGRELLNLFQEIDMLQVVRVRPNEEKMTANKNEKQK